MSSISFRGKIQKHSLDVALGGSLGALPTGFQLHVSRRDMRELKSEECVGWWSGNETAKVVGF